MILLLQRLRAANRRYLPYPTTMGVRMHEPNHAFAGGGSQAVETTPVPLRDTTSSKDTSTWTETEMMNNRPTPDRVEEAPDNSFPHGCFLLTGTGVVPPDSFTLQRGDEIRITIPPIGALGNGAEIEAISLRKQGAPLADLRSNRATQS